MGKSRAHDEPAITRARSRRPSRPLPANPTSGIPPEVAPSPADPRSSWKLSLPFGSRPAPGPTLPAVPTDESKARTDALSESSHGADKSRHVRGERREEADRARRTEGRDKSRQGAEQARGRRFAGLWDALGERGIEGERVSDGLREAGEQALLAVRKWADPRERELRRRRKVRRRGLRLGAASGLTALGTAGLVVVSAPAWAVLVVGSGAAALVTGAAVTTRRYLEMRRNPLPPAAFVPRKLPPIRSAARPHIARLVRAERALHTLGRRIAHRGALPPDDLADTLETAGSAAAALHALATDVTAMEKAIGVVGRAHSVITPGLSDDVRAVVDRLESGVVEYEQLVAAAGRVLAVPESPALPGDLGWALVELRDAADRLDGWAHALTELADRGDGPAVR